MSSGAKKQTSRASLREKSDNNTHSDPIKRALDSFKTMVTSPDTDMLSLWGLQVDVTTNQEAQRTNMINTLLALQESGNTQLEGEKIKQYITDFLALGDNLRSETNVPSNLIEHIRDKKPLTIGGVTQDVDKLQDALEVSSIMLGTEAIGAVYAHMVESLYPDRKSTQFDQTDLQQKLDGVQLATPQYLLQLITTKNIPLSGETLTLVKQLAASTNPLMQAYASEEFAHVVSTTKESFLQWATAYTPTAGNQTTRGNTVATSQSDNEKTQNRTTDSNISATETDQTELLPAWLRGTTAPQSDAQGYAVTTTFSTQHIITTSDSRTYSPPSSAQSRSTSATQTQVSTASGSSGNGLIGIFAGLGIVFGTLYLSQKKGDTATPDTKNFWGNVGKTGLIGLGLTAGVYGAYKGYQYLTDKTGKSAEQNAANSTAGGTTGEGPLYPIPPELIVGGSTSTKTSEPQDDTTTNDAANDTTSPPAHEEADTSYDDTSDSSSPPATESTSSSEDIPGPETGEILTEEQQKQLATLSKEKIDELNAKKTALDETQKILKALPGEHGNRVAKMYDKITKHTSLKLKASRKIKRETGDAVLVVDPAKSPKTMYMIEAGLIKGRFPVSIGKNGIGNEVDSEKTSSGIMLFSNTEITGTSTDTAKPEILGVNSKLDASGKEYNKPKSAYRPGAYAYPQITARKLPLYGLENKNHNAYARGVFCHGTNNPQELGYATSQGCIRLSNADAIQLAEYIKTKNSQSNKVFLGVCE